MSFLSYDKYVAIIGDNVKYFEDIAFKLKIVLGDEFQGLLKNTKNIMPIIFAIKMEIAPIELLFKIGIGDIDIK